MHENIINYNQDHNECDNDPNFENSTNKLRVHDQKNENLDDDKYL